MIHVYKWNDEGNIRTFFSWGLIFTKKVLKSKKGAINVMMFKCMWWFDVLFISGSTATTTPMCLVMDTMTSSSLIPSNQLYVYDDSAIKENLRPTSGTPLISSNDTLIIKYIPEFAKPVKKIKLVNTTNIKTYNVMITYEDGTSLNSTVRNVLC